jgi:hypothetical protein
MAPSSSGRKQALGFSSPGGAWSKDERTRVLAITGLNVRANSRALTLQIKRGDRADEIVDEVQGPQ